MSASPPLRILGVGSLFPPHHFGGYETIWHGATAGLRERGHAVRDLVTDFRHEHPVQDDAPDVEVVRELRWYWHDHDFPEMSPLARLRLERHNKRVLERQLAEWKPDVVMWWAMGGMSLSMLEQVRRRGVPAVGFVADKWMAYGPMRDLWLTAWEDRPAAARLVERVTGIPTRIDIGASARWLFISNWTREALEREVGLTVPDWGIAHSGVDPSRFPPSEPGPWRWRLLYAGRVDERKGIMTAVEALAELPAEATLVIQGGGDEGFAEQLRERSAELGIADRVEFRAPSRDTLAATYAECDALLFPVTWDEPWGLVPIEAMSVGRPVVATGTGGSAEYLRDGENCLLFEPGNAAALASAVRRLAESDELRTGLVEGGRATASHYTEDKFNAQIEQELLAARR